MFGLLKFPSSTKFIIPNAKSTQADLLQQALASFSGVARRFGCPGRLNANSCHLAIPSYLTLYLTMQHMSILI